MLTLGKSHYTKSCPVSTEESRLALGIEYCGARYFGWQLQEQVPSVQGTLEQALAAIAGHPVSTVCAGRTDAGVHATGQVVHFDTSAQRPLKAWVMGVNCHLPDDIRVLWAKSVGMDFHARFSATARRYRYIVDTRRVRSAIYREVWSWYGWSLNVEAMHQAAQVLVGEHDFTTFRAVGCQSKSPMRRLTEISVQQVGEQIVIEVEANAFLHHMVRNIVGSLFWIGRGEKPITWLAEILAARDRTLAGVTAPPQGLYLIKVRYPVGLMVE